MAKQTIDISESATQSAQKINNNFDELYQGAGGGSSSSGVVLSPEAEVTEIPIQLSKGWLNGSASNIHAEIQSYHNPSPSNAAITDLLTITNANGKYIFIPFGIVESGDSVIYIKYTTATEVPSGTTQGGTYNEPQGEGRSTLAITKWRKPYLVVAIGSDSVMYRFAFQGQYASTAKVYVVTKEWLQRNGYVNNWCGKKWVMYGDSYVEGFGLGDYSFTWHNDFARWNCIKYTNKGHNGFGLVKSPNANTLLLTLEDNLLDNGSPLDVDIIGITCGRNDYTTGLPIGDIDDMIEIAATNPNQSNYGGDVTFMGGLNYLCKWLIEHYMDKKIFFITPWYFVGGANAGGSKPADFVDAVLAVSGKWGIPCFDAARRSGIHIQDADFRQAYTAVREGYPNGDDSHLNINGHFRMAKGPVAKWLESLFVD